MVRVLLRSGLPPSAVDIADSSGATPLCYAAGFQAPDLWQQSDYKLDSDNSAPVDEAARLECVKLLLVAEQANYVAKDGPSRALKLQHSGSALAMAQLAGYKEIVEHLKGASREEKLRGRIKQQFDVTKAQDELLNLETLGAEFVKERGVEDSQAAALKQALDERAASLRQWMQQHEDRLTEDAAARSASQMVPHAEDDVLSSAEEELFVLNDPTFQDQLDEIDNQKTRFLKWRQETAAWLEQERVIIQQVPVLLRRLRGSPAGTQPITLNNTGSSLLVDFGDNASGTKRTTQIVGCPELMVMAGVLYYEVVVESDLPGRGYAWDSLSFGFAGNEFEYGIEKAESISVRTVSARDWENEPSTSWAVANGKSVDLSVGDVTLSLNPGPSARQKD